MSPRGLVLTDGVGATELGVSQERAKVALFGPDGTTELCAVDGAGSSGITYLPAAARDNASYSRALNVDRRGSLELGELDLVAWDANYGTISATTDLTYTPSSNMGATYSAEGYRANPTFAVGNTFFSHVKTNRTFPLRFGRPLTYIVRAKVTTARFPYGGASAGQGVLSEIGFFDSGAPTNRNSVGAVFQVNNATMTPLVTINGSGNTLRGTPMEFSDFGGRYVAGTLDPSVFYEWQIIVDPTAARFIIRGAGGVVVYDQTLRCPPDVPRLWIGGVASFQAGMRHANLGNPLLPGDVHMTESAVGYYGQSFQGRPWALQASEHRPVVRTADTTLAAPIWTNSAEPASQTLAQASSVFGIAGKFQFAAPAGAATDFGIMSPPNLTTAFTSGLIITGISIDTWNVGAAVVTTPTHLQWYLNPSSTGASAAGLARFALGSQSFAVGTAIGGTPDRQIVRSFQTPLVFRSSVGQTRWFTLACRVAVGTATASQVIAGFWSIEGYWE